MCDFWSNSGEDDVLTLEELADSLPNGFHDSELKRLSVDFERRRICMDMSLSVGRPDDPPEHREDYRDARVEVSGFSFLVIGQPDGNNNFAQPGTMQLVDAYPTESIPEIAEGLKSLLKVPYHTFAQSFYVSGWNSFIHIAARDCSVSWAAPVVDDKAK
jgi:hypothetical protein